MQSAESSTVSTSSQSEIQSSTQIISTISKPAAPQTSVSYLPPASSSSSTMQVIESASNLPSNETTTVSYLPPSSIETTSSPESIPGSVSYLPPDNSTPIKSTSTPNFESSTASSSPSEKSECTEDGFFPNRDDCRKFYRCVQGQSGYIKYEFQCGPGTAWDQSIQTCNHIAQVPCSTNTDNEINQSSGPSTSNATPKDDQTTLSSAAPISTESTTVTSTSEISTELSMSEANKTESSMTTASASGKPEEIQMPENSSTESSSESASSSSELSESSSSTESHVPDCMTQKPNNTIVCNDEGFYPHPIRCDKFYRCVNNNNGFNVYHFDCPPGTIFDPSITTCNYPESVYPARDCTTGEAVTVSTTSSNISTEPTQPQSETEQPTSTETNAMESTTQQMEENTSASEESTTLEESITTDSEELTSKIPESTESLAESTTESAILTTEATIDSSTSEQTTEAITSMESTETETSTTESQEQTTTEAQEQLTTESQEQSTIESQEQSTTELSESTTVKPAAAEPCAIGNLTDDQIALVCPTGFRRHPKYCNLFYQCTNEGNMEIKILVLSCPENTIFDEQKIQCLPEDRSSQSCTKASARLYRRVEDSSLSSVSIFNI